MNEIMDRKKNKSKVDKIIYLTLKVVFMVSFL